MKIALAQLNPTVGALEANRERLRDAALWAHERGAALVIAPELAICAYPPGDWLHHASFVGDCWQQLETLAGELPDDVAMLLGAPVKRNGPGKPAYNSAVFLQDGRAQVVWRKRLLPTYDVFDEDRWFEAGDDKQGPLGFNGLKLGIHICEDGWNDGEYWVGQLHHSDPVADLAAQGCDLLVNLSASPWCKRRELDRQTMFAHSCRRHGIPGLLANQIGAHDALIFDGSSLAANADGSTVLRSIPFEESLSFVEFDSAAKTLTLIDGESTHALETPPVAQIAAALELGVRDYVRKCGFDKLYLGLSGGVDSAAVAMIAARALGPDKLYCIGMPSEFSSEGSVSDAAALAEALGCSFEQIPIKEIYSAYTDALAPSFEGTEFGIAEENLQARGRGMLLMALANKFGALVLATGNKSELAVGYSTLYGDMCGALEVIGDLWKGEVYALCEYYREIGVDIPKTILTKPPSAELRPDQKDSDSLPDYDTLDAILQAYIVECLPADMIVAAGHDEATVRRVLRMVDLSEYKRQQAPPVLRVSERVFGPGRRMPIAQHYRHG